MPYKPGDRECRVLRLQELAVGDQADLTHQLTQEDVDAFAALTGDFNPLHVDPDFARQTLFGKPVVYGMLSASFVSTMIGMLLPGQGALWTGQTLEFVHPAYVGDTLRVVARVEQKSESTRMMVLSVVVTNQNDQKLIVGESRVRLVKPPPEKRKEELMVGKEDKQTVLVTGGGRGIGAATARRLALAGHAVAVNYLTSADQAGALAQELTAAGASAVALKADVARMDEVDRLFAEARQVIGPMDALVHCAAPTNVPMPFEALTWEALQEQLDVQVRGAFNCVKALLRQLPEGVPGAVVLLGSIFTDDRPPTEQCRYVVAKAALSALARSIAVEYGPKGLRVNTVSPGMTRTEMIALLPEKTKMLTRMQTPLRRLADPDDIANVIAFLLSRSACHITGENIRVCGGLVMS